jgi:tRNA(Ile)-lysidine synthase TilS/MesJ
VIKIIKQLVNKDHPYLFSLSMGTDSVSAFLWMVNKGYQVIPIHFNHSLREQNNVMQKKFFDLCKDLQLGGKVGEFLSGSELAACGPTYNKNLTGYYTEKNKPTSKTQTEANLRKDRLSFYQSACNWASRFYCFEETPIIITAHHLNDYVENYLLNCFRGQPTHTPFEFVSNFEPSKEDNADLYNTSYKILHPFLLTKKEDFKQYLERNNYMKYIVEDETNIVTKGSRRNWIRNKIIPEMMKNKLSLEKYAKRKIESSLKLKSFVLE